MRITHLEVRDVRIVSQAALEPAGGLNLIVGPNGSGKTALLEAIYLVARGRSFRTSRVVEVIRHNQEALTVSAEIDHRQDGRVRAGVVRGKGPLVMRYRGEPVRHVSEMAAKLPVVLMTPDSQGLISGEPKQRRRWLDWAMFHVEPGYLTVWKAYFRALRHRNVLLKKRTTGRELEGWELAMEEHGQVLNSLRRRFLGELSSEFGKFKQLLQGVCPEIRLSSGWSREESLADLLKWDRPGDMDVGFTRSGPHRADVEFTVAGRALDAVYSRGEGVMFVALLLLSQAQAIRGRAAEDPVFLGDDFGAELDPAGKERVLEAASLCPWQTFLTSANTDWQRTPTGSVVFHVEHGRVRKMVK